MLSLYGKSFEGLSKDIWLLSLVMLINRSGAMVLPFLSIYLNQQLGFDLTSCGIIMTCYGIGSVSGAFIGGVLTDNLGYYKVMLGSLILTSLAFLWVMTLKGFYPLCFGFFTISLLADTFRPANLTAIQAFSKKENLTRSIGLVRLAINLGYAIGPVLGGFAASLLGYNFLFILNASSILFAAVFYYKFFKNKKQAKINIQSKKDENVNNIVSTKMPWNDWPYLVYLFLFGIIVIVFFQLIYIIPLFYKTEYGFDESLVGILMAVNGLLIFAVEMPLIYVLEKHFNNVTLVAIGGVLIAFGIMTFAVIDWPILAAIIFIIFTTFGEMLSFPFSNSFALQFSEDHNRGKYMGFYTMTFSLAHVIAPIGWFKFTEMNGYDMTWWFGGALCIAASFLVYLYKLRTP